LFGGRWQSTISLLNPTTDTHTPSLSFLQAGTTASYYAGIPLDLSFLQQPGKTTISPIISPGGLSVLPTQSSSTSTIDSYITNGDPGVNGIALLRADAGGSVVRYSTSLPLSLPFQDRASFPFDNTGGYASLLILVNAGTAPANFTFQVNDENGNSSTPLPSGTLPGHGQVQIPWTGGARGTINATALGSSFYALLFRYISFGPLTTLPGFQGLPPQVTFNGQSLQSSAADAFGLPSAAQNRADSPAFRGRVSRRP
jgi:hypothetical protein